MHNVQIDKKPFFCEQFAKSKVLDLKSNWVASDLPRKDPLDLCMTDVAGPFNMDINGQRFLFTMRDHASMYTFCAAMMSRRKVTDKIMEWVLLHLKNACKKTLTYLCCNNAAKYIGNLKERPAKGGTTLATVLPYHPQQNGKAERYNRTVGDMARRMLHAARLPKIYWSYAYLTAAYIDNRLPNKQVLTSPLEALYKIPTLPNTPYPFGAQAIVTLPKGNRDKLDEQGVKCHLLGYPKAGAGWIFCSSKLKRMIQNTSTIFPDFQELEVKRELRKNNIGFIVNQVKLALGGEQTAELAAEEMKAIAGIPTGPEHKLPKNIKVALLGPNGGEWKDAARYELNKFKDPKFWD
jgi:hypothetical protein